MYKEILKSLKTKYSSLGLSEEQLKVVARRIAKTVKEESEIEEAVNDVSDELALAQKEADRYRTLQKQLEKLQNSLKGKGDDKGKGEDPKPETDPKPTTTDSEMPAWAKAIIENQTKLTQGFTQLQTEKANQTNQQKLLGKLKELGVKESFYKFHISGKTFEKDSDIEEFASNLKKEYDSFLQENNNSGVSRISNPLHADSNSKKGEVSSAVQHLINPKEK